MSRGPLLGTIMLLAWWLEREVVVVDSQEQLLDLPRSNKEDLAHSRANQNTKSNKEKKRIHH